MTVLWLCSEQAVVSCPHERVQCFTEVCALFLLVFVYFNREPWAPPNRTKGLVFPKKKNAVLNLSA